MAHRSSVAVVQSLTNPPDFTNGENVDWLLKLLRDNELEQFYDTIRYKLQLSKYVFYFFTHFFKFY